jgi:hypothetical protein
MAVSIEAAFVLLDKASGPLKEIRKQALLTDKALKGMGQGGTGLGGTGAAGGGLGPFSKALADARQRSKDLGTEVDKTVKKIEKADGWFKRITKSLNDWRKGLAQTHPILAGFGSALGGVVGGLKGMLTALPPLVTLALVAAPAIVALSGAILALGSSLAGAVGGGVLLGGGLLGSFAVGLGSIAAIAKPAITATQNYEKAVKNLNTAIASGSPTAIKARQQQLDAIAKANPGVAQLAGNLKKFRDQWKEATKPARASFFKLAADGIQTLRGLLPTLANEANKNTAALQSSFQKILSPFLDSSTFKGFVSGLGGIFRANLPGFMTGLVNVFKGLASILKVLTPQLDRAGPSFQKFTGNFAKWAASAGGKSTIKEMGKAFSAWLDLVKQIGRVIGSVIGAGMKPGTSEVTKWADNMRKAADDLKKPAAKNSLAGFMSKSLDDVNKLWPVLKQVATDLLGIYKIFKPLGSATAWVIKNMPPAAVTAAAVGFGAFKIGGGAVKGAKAVWSFFGGGKRDGSSAAKALYVTGGLGGGGDGGGGVVSKIKGFAEKFLKGAAAARVMTALRVGGPLAAELLLLKSMDWAEKGPRPRVPSTASNRQGIPPAGFQATPQHPRYTVPKTVSNPNRILLGQQPLIHHINPAHFAHSPTGPYSGGYGFPTPPTAVAPFGRVTGGIDPFAPFVSKLDPKFNKPLARALSKASDNFKTMASKSGDSLSTIRDTAISTSDAIKKKLPQDSATTNQAVAQNYAIAAGDVETSMNRHVISVHNAMKAIAQMMSQAFQALGIKSGVANKLAGQKWSLADINSTISSGQAAGLNTGTGSASDASSFVYASGGRLPGRPQGDHLPLYSRGGNLMGIADGGELVVNRHTEAKADKMLARFGTRLSSLVDNETRPHYARGGRVGGYQTGGVVGEVNSLASAAGFNKIAIAGLLGNAMQESSLNVNAGGGGLWQQISNFGSGSGGSLAQQWATMLPQIASIRNAMNRAGSPGAAAVIFEQSFERAGIPALGNRIRYANEAFAGQLGGGITGGAGVMVPVLKPPKVAGGGAVVAYGQEVINRITRGANQYLQAHGGGGAGMVPGGAKGTVMDPSGRLVAGWIEPILAWARGHGWAGSVTSGYRSFAQQQAIYNSGVRPAARPGTSNHEGTVYPRGAVDVSDASQLSSVLSRSPYASTLVWAGAKDPVHFSHPHGGSYALGGRVPWFAGGADFMANRPQVIGVGDGPGRERVTVTPQGQGRIGNQNLHVEIHKIEVNRKGDVQRIVDEELRLLANTIESHL